MVYVFTGSCGNGMGMEPVEWDGTGLVFISVPVSLSNVHLFVCLPVCCQNEKNAIFSKTKQFRAMVSIDDLQRVVPGLFKKPIIGPLKSKMAEICHLDAKMQKRDFLEN